MQSRGNNKKIQMSKYMVYIVLAVVFVFFAITLRDNGFASTQNLLNILRQTAMISIMSVAGVFVLSAGQIDLTVGSNTAMSAMLVALVLKSTNNIFLALITNRIFCNYSTKFCNHSIPLSSASSVAICVSNASILSIISAVEEYSTATYSVFLYLLIERS